MTNTKYLQCKRCEIHSDVYTGNVSLTTQVQNIQSYREVSALYRYSTARQDEKMNL